MGSCAHVRVLRGAAGGQHEGAGGSRVAGRGCCEARRDILPAWSAWSGAAVGNVNKPR